MKIFLLILFVITHALTFIQELNQWMNENIDLIDSFVQETQIPIKVDELQSVRLNDQEFVSITNGWLAQVKIENDSQRQYFTLITKKMAVLAIDVEFKVQFIIEEEQIQTDILELENYRGMNFASSDANRLVIYPRENQLITQKTEQKQKIIELSNLESDQFVLYLLYSAETELMDTEKLFEFIVEFMDLLESKQPKYKQCKPKKNGSKKKSRKGNDKTSPKTKKPSSSGSGSKEGSTRGSIKEKQSREEQNKNSLKEDFNLENNQNKKKFDNLDNVNDSNNQNGEIQNNDAYRKDKNQNGNGEKNDDGNGNNGDGNGNGNGNENGNNGDGDGNGNTNGNNGNGNGNGNNGDGNNGDGNNGNNGNGNGNGNNGDGNNGNGNGNGNNGDGNVDGNGNENNGNGNENGDGDGNNKNKDAIDKSGDNEKDQNGKTQRDGAEDGEKLETGKNGDESDENNQDQNSNNGNNTDGDDNKNQNNLNNESDKDDDDSENTRCVTLFSECYFSGESLELCGSHAEITDQFQNFKIKSIEMDEGLEISFFGESHFENQVITITDDIECLDIPIVLSPQDLEELLQLIK